MDQDPEEYRDDEFSKEYQRPKRGFAIDLTGMGIRIAATIVIIGVSLLIIALALRPTEEEAAVEEIEVVEEAEAVDLEQPLATFTPGPTSTPPPLDEPVQEGGGDEPAAPPPGELGVGATAAIGGTGGSGVNMRIDSTTAAEIIQVLPDGTPITLVEGPVEGESYVWWRIQLEDGTEGWVVQDFIVQ